MLAEHLSPACHRVVACTVAAVLAVTKEMMMFNTLAERIRSYGAYRQTYRELARLNARELADIGLTPGSIEDVARGRRV
jgi:uncharacterized protein YjiS (DUF1127 family)